MHDLKFAGEILFAISKMLIENPARCGHGKIVVNAHLSVLSHVTAPGLSEAFNQLAEEEGLSVNVVLNIMALGFQIHCRQCGGISDSGKPVFNCPACGSADFEIKKDPEFIVDSVKIGA